MRTRLQERLEEDVQEGINLSPLIDVVFILLIFFIVTTVFVKETGVDIDKPQAVTTEQLESELILIAITSDGEVIYDQGQIGVAGVRPTVSSLLQIQERPVVIQADRSVTTDLLVRVMDEAKLAGADAISIATTVDP